MNTNWREKLVTHGRSLGRAIYTNSLGVGVAFADGCDVFWALPDEIFSTVPVPAAGPFSADELIDAYDRINQTRARTLHVIRHYLASLSIRVHMSPGGEWGLEYTGGASSSVTVGAYLTTIARDTGNVYETVRARIKGLWGMKPPSHKRIDRYLAIDGPPAEISSDDDSKPASRSTIRTALRWMGLCKALEHPERWTTPEGVKELATPSGRIGRTFELLGEKLPAVEASADLLKPGMLWLRFSDGQDSFELSTRSRKVARRIQEDGPELAAERFATEFRSLDDARRRTLASIYRAAAARGWRKDESGGLFSGERTTYLGATHREIQYPPGESLTQLLRRSTPEAVLRELFDSQSVDFSSACIEALSQDGEPAAELPRAVLPPKAMPAAPPLRELNESVLEEMDHFARDTTREYLANERTIWDYRNPNFYVPGVDTWATAADWIEIARERAVGEWPHPMAIVILLDAGDPIGQELALSYLARVEPHHEVSGAEVEIAWRFRHQMPDVATKWFAPSDFEDVPFVSERAALGDPVALRKRTANAEYADLGESTRDSQPETVAAMSVGQQELVHSDLLDWARTTHRWAGPETDCLRLALRMGWTDVADALADNPFLVACLLTTERRADQFDEPGILLAKDFLLVWSRLAPGPFLARILATAHATDLIALAETASRRAAAGKPEVERNVASSRDVYRIWHKDLLPALAIAWTRCRRMMVGVK